MRYVPGRALPPYAFLPGRDPHPTRDPAGHSFGHDEGTPPRVSPAHWRESPSYLWGVDLYNHGFLWEAHEAWEGLWHASKPDRLQASFLQGLIQCSAAWLKIEMRQPQGVARLSALALEKLGEVSRASGGAYMGLDVESFQRAVKSFADSGPTALSGYPRIELAG